MATRQVHTLEWLSAKTYAALCVTGLVDHHIPTIPFLPLEIRKKILYFVQKTLVREEVLCSLLAPGDIMSIDFSSIPLSTNVDFPRVLSLCKSLTSLNMSNWKLGKIPEIMRQSSTLKTVNFSSSIRFEDSDLIAIAQACPNLTDLNISRNDSLSDVGLVALSSTCTRLVSLKMSYLDGVTDTGILTLFRNCTSLESLNIKGGTNIVSITPSGNKTAQSGNEIREHAPSLTVLNAKGLSSVPSYEWYELLQPHFDKYKSLKMGETKFSLPQFQPCYMNVSVCALQELDISWNGGNTDALVALLERCPYLTKLKARACDYVNDKVVHTIGLNCPLLEHLNLARGNSISDASFLSVSKSCPKLKDVDISWSMVSLLSIKELLKNCTKLQRFSMEGCKLNVLELKDYFIALNWLMWLNLSWVNSCSVKFAEELVRSKTELCVCDYYGEEIRGVDFHEVR